MHQNVYVCSRLVEGTFVCSPTGVHSVPDVASSFSSRIGLVCTSLYTFPDLQNARYTVAPSAVDLIYFSGRGICSRYPTAGKISRMLLYQIQMDASDSRAGKFMTSS